MDVTTDQVKAAVRIVATVGEALRELGSVPDGEFYGRLMPMMSLNMYQMIINKLIEAGLVKKSNNILTWVG